MTIAISDIKETNLIVEITRKNKINWFNMGVIKSILRSNGESLNSSQILHEYLVHLQKDLFIFDCENTYLAIHNDLLLAFSKSKHSFVYRIDTLNLTSPCFAWNKMNVPLNLLLRLRNTIDLTYTSPDTDTYKSFLSTISSCSLV